MNRHEYDGHGNIRIEGEPHGRDKKLWIDLHPVRDGVQRANQKNRKSIDRSHLLKMREQTTGRVGQ